MALINILFKVDKSQVDASTASVNQAKAATDQLTASAAKLGQQGSKNTTQFGNTIDGVRLKMQQLKAQIELTNQADTKRIASLTTQYKTAQAQLDKYTASLKNNTQATAQAANGTNGLATSFNNLYSAAKLVIGAQIVKQFVGLSLEAASLSGKVEGVTQAFNRLPGATSLLNKLREATHGTVTDLELMQRALTSTNYKIPLDKLGKLLEFAAVKAQQTGQEVNHLVDYIVSGIGLRSIKRLDDLGFTANRVKDAMGGISLQAATMGQVVDGVSKLIDEDFNRTGGYIETSATKVDQLKVSYEELKVTLSQRFSSSGLIEFFKDVTEGADRFFKTFSFDPLTFFSNVEKLNALEDARILALQEIKELTQVNGTDQERFDYIQQEINSRIQLNAQINDKIAAIKEENKEIAKSKSPYDDQIGRNTKLIEGLKQQKLQISEVVKGLKDYLTTINLISLEQEKMPDTLDALESKVKDLNEQIQNTEDISTKSGIAQARTLQNEINLLQDRIDKIKEQINWEQILRDRRAAQKMGGTKIENPTGSQLSLTQPVDTEALPEMVLPAPIVLESEWDKLAKAFNDRIKEIYDHGFDIANAQVQSLLDADVQALDMRIQKTKDFYDTQILLAGDNEKAKDKLRIEEDAKLKKLEKQRADREKKAALTGIIVNTALGIIKAIATAVTIYDGLVEAAGVAVEGASQYAIASRANYYAKGVIDLKGPGTGTSDSIPSMLSRGESVMTAQETQDSGKTLRMIRAKKLNDKVLDNIINRANNKNQPVGFNDSRLIESNKRIEKAIKSNDIVRKGSHIYEAKVEGDNMKRYIRSKSLN